MPENKNKLTELSEIGEFGLINRLTKNIILKNKSTIKGVGDDAAVLNYRDKLIVVTTDLLMEGIHFNLMYTPLKHLGYKAVIVNLSDIFAMNAVPKQITVSIAVSKRFSLEAIEELYEGIHLACDKYEVDLVGGDTSSSVTGIAISITAIGEAGENEIVYRSTAQKGDLICVSGDLGAAYMGLQLLERENEIYKSNKNLQPELKGYEYIIQRQLKPEARGDLIRILKDLKVKPTAMIDISDGLSSELIHICNNSNTGCKIYEDKIPIDRETRDMAIEMGIEPIISALNGGEDYELLFTISSGDYEKIKTIPQITVIGTICDKTQGMNLITRDGSSIPVIAQGWNAMDEKLN